MKVPTLPPPRPYRANKRIARCRGSLSSSCSLPGFKESEAFQFPRLGTNKDVSSWNAFEDRDRHIESKSSNESDLAGDLISSSWSNDDDEYSDAGEGVEVAIRGYNTKSHQGLTTDSNWNSIAIDRRELLDMEPVPVPEIRDDNSNAIRRSQLRSVPPRPLSRKDCNTDLERRHRSIGGNKGDTIQHEAKMEVKIGLGNSSHRKRSSSCVRARESSPMPFRRRSLSSNKYQANVPTNNDSTRRHSTPAVRRNDFEYEPTVLPVSRGRQSEDETRVFINERLTRGRLCNENRADSSSNLSNDSSSLVLPSPIYTRHLLPSSVYNNRATGIWITTINMSQKEVITKVNAAKYLKAFSFPTENEARESAYANAPARMLPFAENPECRMCEKSFSFLNRPSHCRNCGVCVCSSCYVNWNKLCIPDTYNIKNEKNVRVCTSCNRLSMMFKQALLNANYDDALTIYNTGNINLRCQFATNKGEEIMLPIHCAAMGGSLDLFIWLTETHYCPIKRIRTGNKVKSQGNDELITTSKGKSVIDIAMAGKQVDMLRFLVNEKGANFDRVKDLNVALGALEAVLKSSYEPEFNDESFEEEEEHSDALIDNSSAIFHTNLVSSVQRSPISSSARMATRMVHTKHSSALKGRINSGLPNFDISAPDDDSSDYDDTSPQNTFDDSDDDQSVATTVHDACIICYENSIDCVITPCGHQICCLNCSKSLSNCPVCNVDCKFIRIFRP
jgi:hypothetical protein